MRYSRPRSTATAPSFVTVQSSKIGKIGVVVLVFELLALSFIVTMLPVAMRTSVSTARRFMFIVMTTALSSYFFVISGAPYGGRSICGLGIGRGYTIPNVDEFPGFPEADGFVR